jgi:hypothetical protein
MNLVIECWGMLTAGILPEWLSGIIVHRKVLITINFITGTGCLNIILPQIQTRGFVNILH